MEWLITILFSLIIIGFSGQFLFRHRKMIQQLKTDQDLNPQTRDFLLRQQRRRVFTSALVLATGVLIPVLYDSIVRRKDHFTAIVLVVSILGLMSVVVLLAIADILSGHYLNADLQLRKAELELKKRVLVQELKLQDEEDRIPPMEEFPA